MILVLCPVRFPGGGEKGTRSGRQAAGAPHTRPYWTHGAHSPEQDPYLPSGTLRLSPEGADGCRGGQAPWVRIPAPGSPP